MALETAERNKQTSTPSKSEEDQTRQAQKRMNSEPLTLDLPSTRFIAVKTAAQSCMPGSWTWYLHVCSEEGCQRYLRMGGWENQL